MSVYDAIVAVVVAVIILGLTQMITDQISQKRYVNFRIKMVELTGKDIEDNE